MRVCLCWASAWSQSPEVPAPHGGPIRCPASVALCAGLAVHLTLFVIVCSAGGLRAALD